MKRSPESFQGQVKKKKKKSRPQAGKSDGKKEKKKTAAIVMEMTDKQFSDGWKQSRMVQQIVYNTVEKISLGCNLDEEGEAQSRPQSCGSNDLIGHKKEKLMRLSTIKRKM